MVFSIKTACITETVSDMTKVTIDQLIYELSIGSTFSDLERHLKVISAYVVIPGYNISEIIYDTPTETEIANKKSHDSFQMT